jgi:hypothetical protein
LKRDCIDLLVLWWRYESQQPHVDGYPRECPSTAGYRASRQYDDCNGAMETDGRGLLAQAVGRVVADIQDPYRAALHLLARNHATGVQVWTSVRLPADAAERAAVLDKALELFDARFGA